MPSIKRESCPIMFKEKSNIKKISFIKIKYFKEKTIFYFSRTHKIEIENKLNFSNLHHESILIHNFSKVSENKS